MKPLLHFACDQNWEEMTPTEKGRFCEGCKKEVIDFSEKPDAEILKYMQQHGDFCGRYRPHQVAQPTAFPYQKWAVAGLASLSLLAANTAQAQVKDENGNITEQQAAQEEKETDTFKLRVVLTSGGRRHKVDSGMVWVKKGDTLIGQGYTNKQGELILSIPTSQARGELVVEASMGWGSKVSKKLLIVGGRKRTVHLNRKKYRRRGYVMGYSAKSFLDFPGW